MQNNRNEEHPGYFHCILCNFNISGHFHTVNLLLLYFHLENENIRFRVLRRYDYFEADRIFRRIKGFRRACTRYEKLDVM